MSSQPPAPFQCRYSPQLPELISSLGISLAVSTYQAGKVIFLSATTEEKIVQLPRSFKQAMGLAIDAHRMAVATKDEVLYLRNDRLAAEFYPGAPSKYDALYLPRTNYYTGQVDVHDLHFGKDDLIAVNTSFSCLCTVDSEYSFKPFWQPYFIDTLASEDRCHLNGLALDENLEPAYVTALGSGNKMLSWKGNLENGGILMDVNSNSIIAEGLSMPHSPRVVGDKIYLLQSASGELISIDRNSHEKRQIKKFDSFVRGMAIVGDYAFIGVSRLRKNSSSFKDLEIANNKNYAGIKILHLKTESIVAELIYENSVDEIYDVQILPWTRPGILNNLNDNHKKAVVIPGKSFWARSKE